jgi:hypothetical protein
VDNERAEGSPTPAFAGGLLCRSRFNRFSMKAA